MIQGIAGLIFRLLPKIHDKICQQHLVLVFILLSWHVADLWAHLLSSHTKQGWSSAVCITSDLCVPTLFPGEPQLMATTHRLTVLLFSFLPLLLFTSLSFQVLTSWRPSGSSCSRWCIQTAHPAVMPLCSPRFHNCCGFGENILHCKVQTHSSCLKISEQNLLWDSAWDTRLVTINREMLKVLPPLLALQKVEGWCDVKVEGPTHSWEPAVVKMKRKMCPKPYYSLASRKIAEKMEFCRSGRIRGNMKLLDSESVRGQSPNNENNPCFQWILLKVFLLRKG